MDFPKTWGSVAEIGRSSPSSFQSLKNQPSVAIAEVWLFMACVAYGTWLCSAPPTFTTGCSRSSGRRKGVRTPRRAMASDSVALLAAVHEDLSQKGQLQHWQATAKAVAKTLEQGEEEAEMILAKAFGWTGWFQLNRPSYLQPKLPPALEKIEASLAWLIQGPLQMNSEQLRRALATKPQVYLENPQASYEKALQVAPEQWRSPKSFRDLLLKNPKVLDLTHNCLLTDPAERVINEDGEAVHCDGRCTNCWRVATPKLLGQVLDGVEV
eukprot:s118_g36.t1